MDETSNVSDLHTRLQERAEFEREQVQAIFRSECRELAANLKIIGEQELNTIERTTHVWGNLMSWAVLKAWMRPVAVGLAIFLSICGGSWGLMRWLSSEIQNRLETRIELDASIIEARRTIERIEQTTWGVNLVERPNGRFVVLPYGVLDSPPWVVDERPAIRLSRE